MYVCVRECKYECMCVCVCVCVRDIKGRWGHERRWVERGTSCGWVTVWLVLSYRDSFSHLMWKTVRCFLNFIIIIY